MYKVCEYVDRKGLSQFRKWLETLDRPVKARVQARIFRFEMGNLGDFKSVGKGVYEARFDFGPGHRVYFGMEVNRLILLLAGGDKSTQTRDIEKAQGFWKEYVEGKIHGKTKSRLE